MDNILSTPIIGEVEQSFLDYSLSVITDRAIPSAEDGLKPVARRILYEMLEKGYFNNKPYVKCGQVVGDTMGHLHPHGDASIYGALVWLSQKWMMRYPMISFHGNNGSRDGDPPASYRYTECKLSKLAEATLNDIKKDCVDWVNTYTDAEQEPVYLPGIVPNLLINGTSGIAVAMACSFAPHNLNEIMDAIIYVNNHPNCNVKDLLQFVKGPDFPTGGIVINKDELSGAYLTGKGRARIRGEYTVETKNGRDSIVFTSIPYKVSKEQLIIDIDKLCEEKKLEGIATIRDESNKDGVRFVIELEKNVSTKTIIAKLFKLTRLEDTYSFNQVALVDKSPKLLNLKQLIDIYLTHQTDVLTRKINFDLNKLENKIHILNGLLIALEDIDNIIKLIKTADSVNDAKAKLIEKYKFSEIQAKGILDMKISKLVHLEKVETQNERDTLVAETERLKTILSNPIPELNRMFEDLKKNFGDARRTTITQIVEDKEEKEIQYVEPEKCVVVMTEGGTIKRIPTTSFRTQRRNGKGIKTQDDITSTVIRTNTIDSLMIFTNQGRMYRLLVDNIPVGTNVSPGQSIKSLIAMEPNEEPATMYSIYRDTDEKYVLFVTKNGIVKKTSLDEYVKTKKKTGIGAITLKEDDSLVAVTLVKDEDIELITHNGYILKFNSSEVGATSRMTAGVKGINLYEGDYVVTGLAVRDKQDSTAIFSEHGLAKQVAPLDIPLQKRAGRGTICYKPTTSSGYVVAAALISKGDNVLVVGDKNSICVAAEDIPSLGKTSLGNMIIKNNNILSVSKV